MNTFYEDFFAHELCACTQASKHARTHHLGARFVKFVLAGSPRRGCIERSTRTNKAASDMLCPLLSNIPHSTCYDIYVT